MIRWEETSTCKIHGDYIGSFFSLNGRADRFGGKCSICEDKKRSDEQSRETEINKAEVEAKKIRMREKAGITPRFIGKTFDTYNAATVKQKDALNAAQELSRQILSNERAENLIFSGSVGTGKTHLACSIINSIVDSKRVKMVSTMEMIRDFKGAWRKDSSYTESDYIDWITSLDLLIIDEVGVQFGSDTEKLFIFEALDSRYQACKPTVIISNFDINGITECLGQRVIDRLREDGGKLVGFDWESARK